MSERGKKVCQDCDGTGKLFRPTDEKTGKIVTCGTCKGTGFVNDAK